MTAEETARAMERAFGVLIRGRSVEGKWITWRSVHAHSALAGKTREAERLGAQGVFIRRAEGGRVGHVVGCLNPEVR